MTSTDKKIIESVIGAFDKFNNYVSEVIGGLEVVQHPLDQEIQAEVKKLDSMEDDEYAIFKKMEDIKTLWVSLVEKSIICLRYYDEREPFLINPNKKPQAYGIENLVTYFKYYSSFENMLYGGSKYYRDHVIHMFRVWVLGVELLLKDDCKYLRNIRVTEDDNENVLEKVSIWTLIALTHDLGYPLEKAMEIIDKTKDMMRSFIVNPVVSMDLSFTGVQNTMNDYVLRFISSKMVKQTDIDKKIVGKIKETEASADSGKKDSGKDAEEDKDRKEYVARLQPKYYFKFQKSLEHNQHGIISALIIYKLLIYFLESDYSVNENYFFGNEDCRQFFIRREILRAVASHTCHDIYQQEIYSFAFLLILCDDAQEWGRKYLSELYVDRGERYSYRGIEFSPKKEIIEGNEKEIVVCKFTDKYELETTSSIEDVLKRFNEQSKTYRDIFRDGQDTKNRNFNFVRILKVDVSKSTSKEYTVTLEVSVNEHTRITAKREDDMIISSSEEFYKAFFKVFDNSKITVEDKNLVYEL